MEKTVVPTDAPQAKHAPASSVENGGLTSSVEQHDHGGGFDGELDVSIPEQGKGDEVGKVARALEAWKQNAQERARQREAQEKAEKVAEQEKLRHSFKLADELKGVTSGAVGNVQSVVDLMQSTASEMRSVAERGSEQSARRNAIATIPRRASIIAAYGGGGRYW